ncbi:hypothetical protein WJX72_011179 [[Myrmecia] bisecta]|uniref:NAD(P)-binding domain-containing protein n=1 Tax=[Myrmecia] bisecta TaxID=41462 RepID=A0AAW1Q4M8_9CHLO
MSSLQHSQRLLANRSYAKASRPSRLAIVAGSLEPGAKVLVAGATGGVGQLVTAKLLDRGYKVRAISRSQEKVQQVFGANPPAGLEVVFGDARESSNLESFVDGVDAVCCCTGTTAFPSNRWKGNNGPKQTDYEGVKNLVTACLGQAYGPKAHIKRFLLVSSAGVERSGKFPYVILNLFGVLKWKGEGEKVLLASGLPYTILRPGRLTDGPYTSYDLNTLLQATSGTRRDVQMSPREDLDGETSRLTVAEALVQALALPETEDRVYSLTSTEGDGPGSDTAKWRALFSKCN